MEGVDAQKFGELLGRFESLCERCERCQLMSEQERRDFLDVKRALTDHITWHKATEQAEASHISKVHWTVQMRLMALGIASGGVCAALVTFALNFVFRR